MLTLSFTKSNDTRDGNIANGGPIIDLRSVNKSYKTAVGDYPALKEINLQIDAGEFVSIIGKSGSGKSTLLNMITGIDRPNTGEVFVNDTAVHQLSENRMARWRGKNLGVVFQFFQLLPTISVIENIMLPMDFCRTYPMREREKRALSLLKMVELDDHAYKLPTALSGGQQNAWQSRAPSRTIHLWSSRTSRQATSIQRQRTVCLSYSTTSLLRGKPSSWSPTIAGLPSVPTALP